MLDEPAPDVLVVGFGEASIDLRARWWTKSRVPDALIAQDRVREGITSEPRAAGIEISPSERSTVTTEPVNATETDATSASGQSDGS